MSALRQPAWHEVAAVAGPVLRLVLLFPDGILRRGLEASLASEPGFEVLGSEQEPARALALATSSGADILLCDSQAGGSCLPALVGGLLAAECPARVVLLAQHPDEADVRRSMLDGVRGYLAREDGYSQLLESLREVARGRRALGESVESLVLASYVVRVAARHGDGNAPITSREREVLAQIGRGLANKQIARDLGLSVKTVEKHRSNLMRKLGLHNAAAVAAYAIRQGLVNR